jgi:hypothetical protein
MIWRVELQPESGRSWSGGKENFEQKKNQAGDLTMESTRARTGWGLRDREIKCKDRR